jgi:hypothetical protein
MLLLPTQVSGSLELTNGTTLGAGDYGTVSWNFLGGTWVDIEVQLKPGYQFVNTGNSSNGIGAVFAFTTNTPVFIVATGANPLGNSTGTWSGVGDGTGTIGMDGAGNFGGGLTNTLTGGNNPLGPDIKFTLNGAITSLQLLSAVNSGGHSLTDFFAADICVLGANGACGATGVVFDGSPLSSVPLPGALPLFATGLGALGFLGWRSKRKTQAV